MRTFGLRPHLRILATTALLTILGASAASAAPPRVAFERVVPAPHSLGDARSVAIVHAIGDHPSIEPFIAILVDQMNHSGLLRARDARRSTGPADAYLSVKTFKCEAVERSGEGSTRDVDGNRVRRTHLWVDAVCHARIDVLSPTMKYQSTFYAKGDGTSARVERITPAERESAHAQAAKYAALTAADRITPRRIRETVLLDETAPAFVEGFAMIATDRLPEARRVWEAAMAKEPRSAALRYNLAAVCEALGDRRAASVHYGAARDLAPAEPLYATELRRFARRGQP